MELIIFWLLTVIISFGMQISFAFIIMKNCAEAGYIFNIHKLIEISKLLPKGNIPLFKWIPIINIMYMFKVGKIYIDNIDEYINQLHIQGIIDKMTPEQINEYEEKPNSLNSYIMAIKNDDTIKNFKNKFTENKTKNDNTYFVVIQDKESHKLGLIMTYVDENGEINIIKTAGFASTLTYEEQKKCVISYLKRKIMRTVNKYNGSEELTKLLFNIDNIENNSNAKKWQEKVESILPNKELETEIAKKRSRKLPK